MDIVIWGADLEKKRIPANKQDIHLTSLDGHWRELVGAVWR